MDIDESTKTPQLNEKYIEKLKLHQDDCKEGSDYAVKRFDILIISLSSGAIALITGILKDMIDNRSNNLSIKIAICLFGGAIIVNLTSQITAYYANIYEIKITKSIIRKQKGKPSLPNEHKLEVWKNWLNNSTIFLNAVSFLSFIVGTTFLIIFTLTNF